MLKELSNYELIKTLEQELLNRGANSADGETPYSRTKIRSLKRELLSRLKEGK